MYEAIESLLSEWRYLERDIEEAIVFINDAEE